jgi:hypothetical protein
MSDLLNFLKLFSGPTNTTSASDTRRQILTRLKFIGSVSPHEKIDSHSLKVESPGVWTKLKRTFVTGDSRDTTLYFFSSTIDRSFEIVAASIHSKNVSEQIFTANVLQDLMKSVKGLRAAQQTYKEDKLVVCELEVIIESVQSKLYEYQQAFPEIFTIKDLSVMQINGRDNNLVRDELNEPIIKPPPRGLHVIEEDEENEGKMP